jgi:hypothetical protein
LPADSLFVESIARVSAHRIELASALAELGTD